MTTREELWRLLENQGPKPGMLLHALQSEAVLAALARRLGHDETLWGLTGLVHDLDFPHTHETPAQHGLQAARDLAGLLPDEALHAIEAHNGELNGHTPASVLDFALRAGESVTGLVHAAALMRPDGYAGLQAKSLKKKMKDKAFARNVRRENIRECERLGLDLDEFLDLAVTALAALPQAQNAAGPRPAGPPCCARKV